MWHSRGQSTLDNVSQWHLSRRSRVCVCVSGRWKGGRRISIRMALAWLFMLPIIVVEGGDGLVGWDGFFVFSFSLTVFHCLCADIMLNDNDDDDECFLRSSLWRGKLTDEYKEAERNSIIGCGTRTEWSDGGAGVFYSGLNRGWSDNCTDDQMNVISELFVGGLTWALPLCLCFRFDLVIQARQCCWTTFFRFSVSFINQNVITYINM